MSRFLSKLLPKEGLYCVALALPTGGFKHFFHERLEEAEARLKALNGAGSTVYIAQATFDQKKIDEAKAYNASLPHGERRKGMRTQANALQLKNFFLDIDVGRQLQIRDGLVHQPRADGFRAVAESSGAYAGNDDPIFEGEHEIPFTKYENKKPVDAKLTVPGKATVTVYKMLEGQRYPFAATARWEEYYPGAKMGFQWHIRPYLMLGKCAEALALRKAFPKLLSGMYAQEEMDKGQSGTNEADKSAKGFQTLMVAIEKSTLAQLEEYKTKIKKSDKYSEDQKTEFIDTVDKRIAELKSSQ